VEEKPNVPGGRKALRRKNVLREGCSPKLRKSTRNRHVSERMKKTSSRKVHLRKRSRGKRERNPNLVTKGLKKVLKKTSKRAKKGHEVKPESRA